MIMICPKIVIFTSNKESYIERNVCDEKLCLNHPFYNWGGVENKFSEIIKFLKNEKKNEVIELESALNINSYEKGISPTLKNEIKEDQKISLPYHYNSNPNHIFSILVSDQLNPFKGSLSIEEDYIIKFWEGDQNESNQFNFEYIVSKTQLILPLYLSYYAKKPEE